MSTPLLFTPFTSRSITFKNRIVVSPMCQYSAQDGFASDWHFVHLGSRAVGGASMVMVEATSVSPEGRISLGDLGLWQDAHIEPLQKITQFISTQGCVPGIQLAHAGRKASCHKPWDEGGAPLSLKEGGWSPLLAPSALPFSEAAQTPKEMSLSEIETLKSQFLEAAQRASKAGFKVLELHAAHGYLLHSFLSPLSNERQDDYGGSFTNRIRLLVELCDGIRKDSTIWPTDFPLWVRISATDWAEKERNGWDLTQSIELAKILKPLGVDLIDCSSGGILPHIRIPTGPHYQVPFAQAIREQAQIPTGAVGLITDPHQANDILVSGQADVVLLAREMLRNPYWPQHAAQALQDGISEHEKNTESLLSLPVQYQRGKKILKK
ncbi:MAG: NADH:flavin oxidoreductase/NADH oxidase [Cyanobacteria bacterium]|nr:NADH:flavin oxidoreductase/NADH oxidase [Cyanobacteriota bacterium]